MANKILFIGVGGAGSIMADKATKDYPELFESVAVDCGVNRDLSCHHLNLMDRHPYDESAGFTTVKKNVHTLVKEQQGQVSVSPNKEERLKIDNYEEVYISNTLDYCNRSCFVFFTFLVYWN